jgi:hypothetical protein
MNRPFFLTSPYWSAQRLAILIGFILTLVGSVGAELYVSPVLSRSSDLDQQARQFTADIDTLKNAQAQYLMFQQQGALIYALSASGLTSSDANQKTVASNLYQLSMLDRSTAMMTLIGQLAIAGLTDFTADSQKYRALVDAARASFSLSTYTAVDDFEKATMAQSTAQMASLQQKLLQASQDKAAADSLAAQRKLILLMAVTLGSTFLLAANLLTTREDKNAEAETPSEPGEIEAAQRLVDLAIREAGRGVAKSPVSTG